MLDDPRRGTFDTIFGVVIVKSRSNQWYQELRMQSSFDGPVNFIFGANYLKYKVDEDYYVFNNLFTASARTIFGGGQAGNPVKDCYNYVPISAFDTRSEEHTSELQSLMRISYAVFCLKKKIK